MLKHFFGKPIDMSKMQRTIQWRLKTAYKMKDIASRVLISGILKECPICKYTEFSEYCSVYNFTYNACSLCGHLFLSQVVSQESIREIYDGDSSYINQFIDEQIFNSRVSMIAKPKVTFVDEHISHTNSDEWLDIGSGGCELLYAARQAGWKVRGIEAGKIGVEQGHKLGISVEQVFLTEDNAHERLGTPKVISLFDILEHIQDPLSMLQNIVRNAKKTSNFVIVVPRHPSMSSYVSSLYPDSTVRHLVVPDHIHIFTEQSLQILLDSCDLECTCMWCYGQDFYEILSMLTQQSTRKIKPEINNWPSEILHAMSQVQLTLDEHGLSDSMLVIAKRKC